MPTVIDGVNGVNKVAPDSVSTNSFDDTMDQKIAKLDVLTGRNKIINGNFDIWQRGTSQTTVGYGSADRWCSLHVGTTKTMSRQSFTLGQTEVPGNPTYYMRHVVSSVAAAGNYCLANQRIEYVKTLSGKTATLSFWAKADATKNIAVEFEQYFGAGGTPSANVNSIGSQKIALTTTWSKYTVTVTIPSISGKVLGTLSDLLQLNFWFDAGSNWNSRAASLGQQSGTFDIAQVQLEEGSVATPFEHRHIGEELVLCQRYFEVGWLEFDGYALTGSAVGSSGGVFKQTKRAIPIMSYGSLQNIFNAATAVDRSIELEVVLRAVQPTSSAHLRARQVFFADAEL